jgi:hypothetical protein
MSDLEAIENDPIALAASLRAAGETWEQIGAKLGRGASRVRHWPREHARKWARHYRRAETVLLADAAAEARQALRVLLRAGDDKLRLTAALNLLRVRQAELARDKKLRARPGKNERPLSDEEERDVESMRLLRSMSPEELERVLRQDIEEVRQGAPPPSADYRIPRPELQGE